MSRNGFLRVFALIAFTAVVVVLTLQMRPHVVNYITTGPGSYFDSRDMQEFGSGPLAFVRKNGYVNTLVGLNLDNLTLDELVLTIHSYPDNIETICERKVRMGKIGDGGWEICDDPDVRPTAPCIIYSYGIHYDFSFDDDAAKVYGCHVYSFDPSMDKMADQVNRSDFVHFYKVGLSGQTQVLPKHNWKLYTHGDLRKMIGHQDQTIDVIKMDIEAHEWNAIPEMAATGQLTQVKQFLVEFHVSQLTREYLVPKLKAMQDLELAGFKRFYSHKNYACGGTIPGFPTTRTRCYELHYIRR
ncbi:uncharacterized protein LOC131957906 isoform X2 [Physella acuta]|uniref:uncharacterized protein LOC131957906 isoform X2 n=1 Tax=Physella acuta TaxID=109671 RepID=UPI0027DBBBD7|nr:uncharacterized protein LOC131957906 isoform X2 [Physella acuta]